MAVEIDYTANSPVNLYNTHPLFQCPNNLLNHPNLFVILDLIVLLKGASCC